MTPNEILQWARSHDWGTEAYISGSRLTGLREVTILASGEVEEKTISLPLSIREIRAWAGY